uniref:Uncharacterized protein n=1 Tax=Trypanosoma vivax (strain Y486) TaxID=1055687 RepID=G0U5Q7_TRYVY|nr:conserved hypothetical protein, fragment [Trypanosoma vivax Y486]
MRSVKQRGASVIASGCPSFWWRCSERNRPTLSLCVPMHSMSTLAKPTVFYSLRDCRERARHLLKELTEDARAGSRTISFGGERDVVSDIPLATSSRVKSMPCTLLQLHEMAEDFVSMLDKVILLPIDVMNEVEDFPAFLLRSFREHREVSSAYMDETRALQNDDETVMGGFAEWMESSFSTSSTTSGEDVVSFVELMRLVGSYIRYHRGVRWGGGHTKEEWYRRGYRLHPWHETYCPTSPAEQMPYVHLLQWLLRKKPKEPVKYGVAGGHTGKFPSTTTELDSNCSAHDEARVAKTFKFVRCDLLPTAPSANYRTTSPQGVSVNNCGDKKEALLHAAQRRRFAARRRCTPVDSGGSEVTNEIGGSFDILVFHPPPPPLFPAWPFLQEASEIADWSSLDAGRRHPHCHFTAIHKLLGRLLHSSNAGDEDAWTMGANPQQQHQHRSTPPILRDGGYVAFILPSAFDVRSILQRISRAAPLNSASHASWRSDDKLPFATLADAVIATLEGSFELLMRRRHSHATLLDPTDVTYRNAMSFVNAFVPKTHRSHVEQEINSFYRAYQAIDLVIMKKKPTTGSVGVSGIKLDHQPMARRREAESLAYEESFEYTEYIPSAGPPLSHHWTELTPSYSYLEDDFFSSDATGAVAGPDRNFLAVGHSLPHLPGGKEGVSVGVRLAQPGTSGYRSMYTRELKNKRSRKLRKISMSSLEKQEWYIDEKLVKSEAAKIDLINELSRFEMKDFD